MNTGLIKNIIPDFFIRKFGTGSATLARLAHINQVQEDLANAVPYTFVGAHVNHPLGLLPSISMQNASADCGCGISHAGKCNCITIALTSLGKYTITFSEPLSKGFDVLITPLADARQNIGVEVISPTQVIVSTYDIPSGAYVNNALKNTFIAFMLWN